jgi:lectin-like protein
MCTRARRSREWTCRTWIILGATACAVACLPSGDLNGYSSGSGSASAPPVTDGETPAPGSTTPGNDAVPGNGGDEPDPSMLAPSDPEPEGEQNNANNGNTSQDDAGSPLPAPADAGVQGPCAAGELVGPDEHCYFIQSVALAWDAARSGCQARGASWDLAVVRTEAESTFLAAEIAAEVWLGATDTASEGNWSWVTDSAPFWVGAGTGAAVDGAYTNWNSTEPNGGVTTNCLRALPNSFGSPTPNAPWADLPCEQLRASVCENHAVTF